MGRIETGGAIEIKLHYLKKKKKPNLFKFNPGSFFYINKFRTSLTI